MIRPVILIGFALWVLGSEPPYKRATFPDYVACVAAGHGDVDTMRQWYPARYPGNACQTIGAS